MNALPAVALRHEQFEEVRKSKKTKRGAKAKVIRLVPRRSDTLSPLEQEEMVLEHRIKARSLAHSILRRWHSRIEAEEVESIVDLSLCEAVKRFKRSKGASFITFLFYHLRGNLIRSVAEAANLNFVPLPDFDQTDNTSDGNHGNKAKVINAIEIADTLCNHDYESPDEVLLKKEISKISSDACSKLDTLEREVIYRIYVLEEQLMDIASTLGYSRCHISRVKRKALETLHGDLSLTIHPEGDAPEFALEEERTPRKLIKRRKPRSKKIRLVKRSRFMSASSELA